MAILGISVVNRFKRRNTFIVCDALMCSGTFILATYCYFNQDESLTLAFPYAKWIPILAIMLMYVAFACGIGSIPYAYQVKKPNNFWGLPNFSKTRI